MGYEEFDCTRKEVRHPQIVPKRYVHIRAKEVKKSSMDAGMQQLYGWMSVIRDEGDATNK
jgi:hypothetical protein